MGKKITAMFGILDGGEDHPYPPDRQFSCEASCKETWKWPTSLCERHTTFWAQDETNTKTLEVKQIGTAHNVGDIGQTPWARIASMPSCLGAGLHDKDGDPIGEEDAMKIEKAQVNKTKIIRVAKFLQTMVLS